MAGAKVCGLGRDHNFTIRIKVDIGQKETCLHSRLVQNRDFVVAMETAANRQNDDGRHRVLEAGEEYTTVG